MTWTYRYGLVGGSILLLLQACGGRSTTDFTIYDEGSGGYVGQGGAQSKGGTSSYGGVSAAGGSYGGTSTGGYSYGGAYPSVGGAYAYGGAYGYGGAYAYGGAYGYGGAYAFGGAYGTGGYAGEPNQGVAQACAGFCEPYAKLCPDEAGGGVRCARECIRDLRNASAYCRQFGIDVLNCMSSVLWGQMTCEQGMLNAILICSAQFGNLECDEPPPPPNCPGYGMASPGYCTLIYDCGPGQSYGIECSGNDQFSTCNCNMNGLYTGQTVIGYGADPCANAYSGCGF